MRVRHRPFGREEQACPRMDEEHQAHQEAASSWGREQRVELDDRSGRISDRMHDTHVAGFDDSMGEHGRG